MPSIAEPKRRTLILKVAEMLMPNRMKTMADYVQRGATRHTREKLARKLRGK